MKVYLCSIVALVSIAALAVLDLATSSGGRPTLADSQLAEVRGTAKGFKRQREGSPAVDLWTNCAEVNRGGRTETARCYNYTMPNHNNGDDCIGCEDTGQEPAVDRNQTETPGYVDNTTDPQRNCTGNLWKGTCTGAGDCNLTDDLNMPCNQPVLKYIRQTVPTPP